MLDKCTTEERWSGVNDLIERWLQERQFLIVQYCAVSGVHEFSPKSPRSQLRLQKFCQLLVDYVSAGHFEVYYELIREAEAFDDGTAETAATIFPRISSSTEYALGFNDKYGEANNDPNEIIITLPKSLSALGETLASRFELEDQLIEMHNAHREQVA
jgi:regulator of sigma D